MQVPNFVYFAVVGCVFVVFVAAVVHFSVNSVIKQLTERALAQFQSRLSQEAAQALAGFKAEICEQMALQERKTGSLARLYSVLIDLARDGKEFTNSLVNGEPFKIEKGLRTFTETSRSLRDQISRESLDFSDEFRALMEGFCGEQERLIARFEEKLQAARKNAPEHKQDHEAIRQAWAGFEDRIAVVMEQTRNEFRGRTQTPENIMKKWLGEATFQAVP